MDKIIVKVEIEISSPIENKTEERYVICNNTQDVFNRYGDRIQYMRVVSKAEVLD